MASYSSSSLQREQSLHMNKMMILTYFLELRKNTLKAGGKSAKAVDYSAQPVLTLEHKPNWPQGLCWSCPLHWLLCNRPLLWRGWHCFHFTWDMQQYRSPGIWSPAVAVGVLCKQIMSNCDMRLNAEVWKIQWERPIFLMLVKRLTVMKEML